METTHTLSLPYIIAAQAQKHVTHTEALRMLDALTQIAVITRTAGLPPAAPAGGQCWLVPETGTDGEFVGHEGQLAAFQDGALVFFTPSLGWSVHVIDEGVQIVLGTNGWQEFASVGGGGGVAGQLGLNAQSSASTRLAVGSDNSLFTHDTAGSHRMAINRADTNGTASLILQTGFQADAELGLAGLDDMALKVRSSAGDWSNALTVDRETGSLGPGVFGFDRWKGGASGGSISRNSSGQVALTTGSVCQVFEEFPEGSDEVVFGVAGLSGGVLRVTMGGTVVDIQPGDPFAFSTITVTPGASGTLEIAAPSGAVTFERLSLVSGAQLRMARYRNREEEFALCQRFFVTSFGSNQQLQDESGSVGYHMGIFYAAGNIASQRIQFPRRMRVPPTLSYYSPNTGNVTQSGRWQVLGPSASYANAGSMGIAELTQTAFVLNVGLAAVASGDAYLLCGNWSASAEM